MEASCKHRKIAPQATLFEKFCCFLAVVFMCLVDLHLPSLELSLVCCLAAFFIFIFFPISHSLDNIRTLKAEENTNLVLGVIWYPVLHILTD